MLRRHQEPPKAVYCLKLKCTTVICPAVVPLAHIYVHAFYITHCSDMGNWKQKTEKKISFNTRAYIVIFCFQTSVKIDFQCLNTQLARISNPEVSSQAKGSHFCIKNLTLLFSSFSHCGLCISTQLAISHYNREPAMNGQRW